MHCISTISYAVVGLTLIQNEIGDLTITQSTPK